MYRIKYAKSAQLTEAFRKGKSAEVVKKLANILTRSTGKSVTVTTYANSYKTKDGTIISYYGHYDHKNLLRFNFISNNSDALMSMDIWEPRSTSLTPSKTVNLDGYNIVQVVDQLADVLSGKFTQYVAESTRRKTEARVTLKDWSADFLRDNPQVLDAINSKSINWDKAANEFLSYIQTKYNSNKRDITGANFRWNARKAIESNPDLQKSVKPVQIPCIQMTAPTVVSSTVILDAELAKLYDEVMKSGPIQAFEQLEKYVTRIGQQNKYINGCIAYGKPGTGKTYTVEKVLEGLGANYETIKGGIGSAEDLLEVLYKYKDNMVLVFDDNDAIFNSGNKVNIMKIALDSNNPRKLGQGSAIKRSNAFPNPDFDPRAGENDAPESDPAFNGRMRKTIPANFIFDSKIIVCSNLIDFPPAILSRVANVKIDFGKDEMLEYIKSKLHGTMADNPDVTDDDRDAVFEFLEKVTPALEDVSFRLFTNLLGVYMSCKEDGTLGNWKLEAMMWIRNNVE